MRSTTVRHAATRHAERHRVDQVAADRKSRAGVSLPAAELREKLLHRNGVAALTLSDRFEQHLLARWIGLEGFVTVTSDNGDRGPLRQITVELDTTVNDPS
jgi:cell division protein FtsX